MFKKILILFLIIIFLVIVSNFILNINLYVTKYTIKDSKIDEDLNGYKIVQLTDIHSIRNEKQISKIISKVKKEKPNVIFVTGDLIDSDHYLSQNNLYAQGKIDEIERLTIEFMEKLTEITDVYYVYGNHEMMLLDDPENNSFKVSLKQKNIKNLNNLVETITIGDSKINLIGLQDPATLYKDKKYAYIEGTNRDVTKVILDDLFEEEIDENNFTILIAHRPEYFDLYSEYDIDLAFTGHTHGGIIRLPIIGGLYAHPQGWFPKYSAGLYKNEKLKMILSRGIGYSKLPIRVFDPPEIVSVTLKKNNN